MQKTITMIFYKRNWPFGRHSKPVKREYKKCVRLRPTPFKKLFKQENEHEPPPCESEGTRQGNSPTPSPAPSSLKSVSQCP